MTTPTMTAVRLHAPGPATTLRPERVPVPVPGPGQVLPLEEAAAAHAALENRQTVGKVVLLTRAA